MNRPTISVIMVLGAAAASSLGAPVPVQVDVKSVLNARVVTTFANGKIQTSSEGLDAYSLGGGYSREATESAAAYMTPDVQYFAFPDDGVMPANKSHPDVKLNFSNDDATGKQVRLSNGAETFGFAVPAGKYSKLIVAVMSANGTSNLDLKMSYGDGSTTVRNITVLDWYNSLATTATHYNLAVNLSKWDASNTMTEGNHHYLFGHDLSPDSTKTLVKLDVAKNAGGTLTFWGATALPVGVVSGIGLGAPGSVEHRWKGSLLEIHSPLVATLLDPRGHIVRTGRPGSDGWSRMETGGLTRGIYLAKAAESFVVPVF